MHAASSAERARMVELSAYDFDHHPPGFEEIDRPDVYAWQWPNDWHAHSRGVARATFADADVSKRVREIAAFFARRGRTARWHIGPSTRSRALLALLRKGAGAMHEPRMMTAELSELHFRVNPDVRIVEVRSREVLQTWLAACFPDLTAEQLAQEIESRWMYLQSSSRRGGDLVAYLGDGLVGSASWRDASDGSAVQFVGGWTIPHRRGQGVYSTLCAYRAARARERGFRYAAILADPTTSGPVVAKAGFEDHGPELIFTEVRL
jgi:GNAT superfamily N-acetyltransferase